MHVIILTQYEIAPQGRAFCEIIYTPAVHYIILETVVEIWKNNCDHRNQLSYNTIVIYLVHYIIRYIFINITDVMYILGFTKESWWSVRHSQGITYTYMYSTCTIHTVLTLLDYAHANRLLCVLLVCAHFYHIFFIITYIWELLLNNDCCSMLHK